MTTNAHEITRWEARQWEDAYESAVISGILPDAAHLRNGGYHVSIEDNKPTNYSVIRPNDKAPPGTWSRKLAAAIDMSMSPSDMVLCSNRLLAVWKDPTDPRRKYINAFNGWFGSGDAKRVDFVTNTISTSTPDHKWHVHEEEPRCYVADWTAARARVSILRGETKEQYIQREAGLEMIFGKVEGSPDYYSSDLVNSRHMPDGTFNTVIDPLIKRGVPVLEFETLEKLFDGLGPLEKKCVCSGGEVEIVVPESTITGTIK